MMTSRERVDRNPAGPVDPVDLVDHVGLRDHVDLGEPVHLTVDGTSIATRTLEPDGRSAGDVVLCHGTPWSAQVWAAVAHALRRDHRVLLWDMPGYGDSEKGPDVATGLSAQAERLVSLLGAWGVDRPHVIAHDIGGAVALRAHLLHGSEFADMFLWDIVTLEPWGSPFFRLVAAHADVFARLPDDLHAALVREYIRGAVVGEAAGEGGESLVDVESLAAPWLGPVGKPAFYRQIAGLNARDTRPVADALHRMRCPVRIGWGGDDPWIPVEQAYELRARLPGAPDVIELAGTGHLTPCERPTAVIAAIIAWLGHPRR